jgi:NAD(P)-dependent dehydrogenase (short-subunit alcohol dehydrogenase family)
MAGGEKKPWAVVTGASAGIGRAIAKRLSEDGYGVVTIDRVKPQQLLPNEAFYQADLSERESTVKLLSEIAALHPVTTLVNNVGIVRPAPIEEATLEDLHAVVALNLGTSILCAQAFIPLMKKAKSGRIINISSRVALGKELRTVYAATKAGLHGMTRTWALELAPFGITVNAVGPGPIATELFHQVNPPSSPRTQAIIDGVPVRRLGVPDDIAQAVAFFSDQRSSFITGQVIYVCGGMTIGVGPL